MTLPTPQNLFESLGFFKGSMLHPQWLSDRYHEKSRRVVTRISDRHVIDIGCGNSFYEGLDERGNTLIRLDYPSTNQRYKLRPDIFGDAAKLPFDNGTFDTALLLEVLEHLPAPEQALDEATRVLKRDGLLYVSVPFFYPTHDAPYDFQRYTRFGLRRLLEKREFSIETEIQYGNSLVTALQMLNLALLEIAREASLHSPILGLLAGIPVYFVCLINNLLAGPWIALPWNSAACFGWFIIARKQ